MNLFRYPFSIFWEDCALALCVMAVAGGSLKSVTVGAAVGAVSFLYIMFRWVGFYGDASPKEATYDEKIKYAYPAACIFAASMAHAVGLFCLLVFAVRYATLTFPKEIAPYLWLRSWILGLLGTAIFVKTAFQYRFNSRAIKYN